MAETTTISRALASALIAWRDELIWGSKTTSALTPAEVLSGIQNVCIDTRLHLTKLPTSIRMLHDDAMARDRSFKKGGRDTTSFIVTGLVRTLNDAIA
jgi:hypothetical protein